MKTKKWMCVIAAAAVMMTSSSCHDWGEMDPPAANDVYPTLENVAQYTFEDEILDPMLFKTGSYTGTDIPELVTDDTKGQVLYLNHGYVTMTNPLAAVTCQNGVSLTFWMKQDVALTGDDDEAAPEQDLTGALIGFTNANDTGRLFFTANGWLSYSGIDGEWSENDPSQYKTGYITPGEWHYVALIVRDNGYGLYVDGERKTDKVVTDFDSSKLVKFMNKVSTLYIGKGSDTETAPWMIDDLKIYRNQISDKEIARPNMGGGSGPGGFDFGSFDFVTEPVISNIGSPDCTAGWWQEFSNYYRIPAETNLRLSFTNHTSGGGNWNNWNLCLCTDADRGAEGYEEYFVIRSDLFGWGGAYNGDNFSNTGYGDWDKFRADMEGAEVVIDITRSGAEIFVKATATCKDGTVYVENFHAECGDGLQVVRAFLIVDGSYLEMHTGDIIAYLPVEISNTTVGATDNSTGWWQEFSDYFTLTPGVNLNLSLINHTSGGGNWNNWCLCACTDAERGGDGYTEYFVVRSDLFGWGECYIGDNWNSSGYGDWDKFRVDMEGAAVNVKVERKGATVTYTSVAVAPDGTVYTESLPAECGDGSQTIRAFLIVDGSHFVLNPAECYIYVPVYK